MYYGDFSNKHDVERNFNLLEGELDTCVVFCAAYGNEGYDGYAFVVYLKDGKFYLVEGSHCSCYGLEDQWEPEEMPLKALEGMLERIHCYGGGMDEAKEGLIKSLKFLRDKKLDQIPVEQAEMYLKLAY